LSKEKIAYHTIRGYWIVRYLEAIHPGLLKTIFQQKHDAVWIDKNVASDLGINTGTFWNTIDDVLVNYFKGKQRKRLAPFI